MTILRSGGNGKKLGRVQKAALPKGEQLIEKNFVSGSLADLDVLVAWLKQLALDPCDPKASSDSASQLRNQILLLRKVLILSNAKCPQRKRKFEQFLKGGKFTAASGLASEKSSNPSIKKLGSGQYSSASCLPNSVDTTECSNRKTVQNSCNSGSRLTIENSFPWKQLNSGIKSLDKTTKWGLSKEDIFPSNNTEKSVNGSNPSSPENRIEQNAPSMDAADLVLRSYPRSRKKALLAARFLNTKGKNVGEPVVPVGPSFQAELPEWIGPINKGNLYNSDGDSENLNWLGTRIWPIEGVSVDNIDKNIGKGRPNSCSCASPGSSRCTKRHVREASLHLQSDLGPAFVSWKFDEMGEVVSKSWTSKEQSNFKNLVKKNPLSCGTGFWKLALMHFSSKCQKSLLSYYYNVFMPRRIRLITSSTHDPFDSDEDQIDDDEDEDEVDDGNVKLNVRVNNSNRPKT